MTRTDADKQLREIILGLKDTDFLYKIDHNGEFFYVYKFKDKKGVGTIIFSERNGHVVAHSIMDGLLTMTEALNEIELSLKSGLVVVNGP